MQDSSRNVKGADELEQLMIMGNHGAAAANDSEMMIVDEEANRKEPRGEPLLEESKGDESEGEVDGVDS